MNQQTGIHGDHAHVEGGINFNIYSHPTQRIPLQHPPKAEHFKGRDEILNKLLPLLQPGEVVAICGPGGMGKTALAAQAAWTLAPGKEAPARFPDGIIFYSFYGKHTAEEALAHIVRSYDKEQQDTSFAAAFRLMASKQALLILDGAEEADDLSALLKVSSACGVLITSRKKEDARGARLDLEPLEDKAAAQVFLAYSGAAADDESVAGICKILGGWPVALRIAGRYLSSTKESAATYLKWLPKKPFRKLATDKHKEDNIALLLERSVAQISADAVQVLRLAGVLAFASISLEPVMAVLYKEDEDQDDLELRSREALAELVNYGLLDTVGERWQTSHALIHTYAREELALNKESLEQLAKYYISFCQAASAENAKGFIRLDAERAHCLRLMESCLASGLWQEVKALEGAIWEYLDRQGHWADRLTALSMRLTAAQQAGNRKDEGDCLNNLGYTCNSRGEYERALTYYEQSLPIYQQLGDREGEGATLNNIAGIYRQQGKHELALQQYQQSLSIAREVGDRKGEGRTLNNIASVYMNQGEWETALPYLEQCLPIMQEIGYKIGEGATLNNIAAIYRAQGNPAKALEYYEQALAICQQLGDRAGEAVTRWNIGLTYEDLGDLAKAEEHISLAVQIAEKIGHPLLKQWREGLARVRAARLG